MPRKKQESASRSRPSHRTDRRERRRHNTDHKRLITREDDEETGNDTMVEFSSDDANSDSESEEDSPPPRRNRYFKNSKYTSKGLCFCTRQRLRCWHETFRDVAIILILLLLMCATLKDSQLKTIMSTYDQISNFTKSLPYRVQTQHHSKPPRPTI